MPSVAARERGREVPKAQTNLAQVTQSPALVTGWCDKICAKSNLRKTWLYQDKGLSWWGGMEAGNRKLTHHIFNYNKSQRMNRKCMFKLSKPPTYNVLPPAKLHLMKVL